MNKVQFMHFRPTSGFNKCRGGATVAIMPIEPPTSTAGNTAGKLLVSMAKCNAADVFNKKIGREIAAGRLRAFLDGRESAQYKVWMVDVPDIMDDGNFKRVVADDLKDDLANYGLS